MTDDAELLRRYARDRSEEAFAELVRRHIGLVYSAALPRVGGDRQLAEDVTQGVFRDLARKTSVLARRREIAGWLHTGARFAATDLYQIAVSRMLARGTDRATVDAFVQTSPKLSQEQRSAVLRQVSGAATPWRSLGTSPNK